MGDVCMNLTVDKANLILNGFGKAIKKNIEDYLYTSDRPCLVSAISWQFQHHLTY